LASLIGLCQIAQNVEQFSLSRADGDSQRPRRVEDHEIASMEIPRVFFAVIRGLRALRESPWAVALDDVTKSD
jgi:hypothetical protein